MVQKFPGQLRLQKNLTPASRVKKKNKNRFIF